MSYLKRISDDSGRSWIGDTRSPEQAAADAQAEQDASDAKIAGVLSCTAFFDDEGVCRYIMQGHGEPPQAYPFSAPVRPGTRPDDVFFNRATGRPNKSKPPSIALPNVVAAGETFTMAVPEGTVAEVDGVLHKGEISIDTAVPRRVVVELHGKERGTFHVDVRGYAEERKAEYPPIPDQLDMIVNLGIEGYRAEMQKVKAKFPKPAPAAAKTKI